MKNLLQLLYFVAFCILLAFVTDRCNQKPETITTIKTKTDTIVKIIDNTKPTKIEKVYHTIKDTVFVQNDTVIEKIVYRNKLTNKYKYIDSTANGIIESTIIADSIFKRDIKFTAFSKTITTNIKETIVPNQLYVGPIMTFDNNKQLQEMSLNAFYTFKGKLLLTAGLGYNNQIKSSNYKLGIALKF